MTSSSIHGWYITGENEPDVDRDHYDEFQDLFSIKLHHGGTFTGRPGRKYEHGKVNYIHCVHRNDFNEYFLNHTILKQELGYEINGPWYFYYMIPGGHLDRSVYPLQGHHHYLGFLEKTMTHRIMSVYVETSEVSLSIIPLRNAAAVDRVRQMQRDFTERLDRCS